MNNDGIFDFTFLVAHLDELSGNEHEKVGTVTVIR
jgi:hypothetical protein